MPPLFFDIALGYASPDSAGVPIENLAKFGVNIVKDEVESIDLKNRAVKTKKNSISYDYLVISLGTVNGWNAYPGLDKEGFHNYDLEGAIALNKALKQVRDEQQITILIPELPYRCGIYPYEAATVLHDFFLARGKKVKITIIDPLKSPAEPLGNAISSFLQEELESRNVLLISNAEFREIDPESRSIILSDEEIKYDLLIKVPPARLPKPLANNEDLLSSDKRWTKITVKGNHPEYNEVFFAGEHSLPPLGLGLAGVFVESLAITSASNLVADMAGGISPTYLSSGVTCVGYAGNAGWIGTCQTPLIKEENKYAMNCYFLGKYAPAKFIKQAFYHGWLDALEHYDEERKTNR